jgi:hypothetical protein
VVGDKGLPRQQDIRQDEEIVHAVLQHVVDRHGALHSIRSTSTD